MAYELSKLIIWPLLKLFIKKIEGIENLPKGPYIMAVNHSSYIDGAITLMIAAWYQNKKAYTFATNEKFKGLFWNTLIEHFGGIRVNGSLEKALKKLKQGNIMIIYPEGQRTYTGDIQKTKHTGLGVLALQSKKPIVPVYMNTFKWWNRYNLLPNFKHNIEIKIGKPLHFNLKPTPQNYKKVTQTTLKEVKKLAPHY